MLRLCVRFFCFPMLRPRLHSVYPWAETWPWVWGRQKSVFKNFLFFQTNFQTILDLNFRPTFLMTHFSHFLHFMDRWNVVCLKCNNNRISNFALNAITTG